MSIDIQRTISPVDQSVVVERCLPSNDELERIISKSAQAFASNRHVDLEERIAIAQRFLLGLRKYRDELSEDLSRQMGRPIAHCVIEVDGTIKRGETMISFARGALADITNEDTDQPDHVRIIKRVPVGVVLVISPWNYPYFCQVNAVLPALLAGNAVLLKPSPQTPLCGEWYQRLYQDAGLPDGLLQILHITPDQVDRTIRDPRIGFVMFTGSVNNGHAVIKSASESFKGVGVELGGKDPAYVRQDANLEKAAAALADGVFFNAGQSCCSVERIYVHESIYDQFLTQFVEKAKSYRLGDPEDAATTLGPVVSRRSAEAIRKQVQDAVKAGAKPLLSEDLCSSSVACSNYVMPQVLVNVDHSMSIMVEETFGPVVGVMKVKSDAEAIKLMNDSPYGLTASVWTDGVKSGPEFDMLAEAIEAGTVYLNNADNLDPSLAWSGWKDSGRGVSLSKLGFDSYLKTKSINKRLL